MGARELRHEARLMEWREKIAACRSSGMPVRTWCQKEQVRVATYYRWEKEVLARAEKQLAVQKTQVSPVFVQAPVYQEDAAKAEGEPKIAARVHTRSGAVDIFSGADEATVGMLLRVLRDAE